MDQSRDYPDQPSADTPSGDLPEALNAQLSTIERAANSAHTAIDRLANKADHTLRRVRDMAAQARQRFQTGCKNYSQWEDECVENTRERIRAKPLTAVALGLAIGLLIGRSLRAR